MKTAKTGCEGIQPNGKDMQTKLKCMITCRIPITKVLAHIYVVKQSIGGSVPATETSSGDASTRRGVIFIIWPIWSERFLKVEREEEREILENKG